MSTIKKRSTGFAQIPNELLEDTNLSFKAKGLYAYMVSRPDGWQFYESQLSKVSKDGKDATNSALNELIDAGWIEREEERERESGRFGGYIYHIHYHCGLSATAEPQRLNRNGKPATNNTNQNNTDGTILTDNPPMSPPKKKGNKNGTRITTYA